MLRTRIAAGALALAAAMTIPAAALAAGDTIKVTGPTHVTAGHKVTFAISGRTAKKTQFSVFLDPRSCARTTNKEAARSQRTVLFLKSVNGKYRDTVTFLHSSAGTHYICAYLYDSGSKVGPDKRATHKYVTH